MDNPRARISELNSMIESVPEHTPEVSEWVRERNQLMDELALEEAPIAPKPVTMFAGPIEEIAPTGAFVVSGLPLEALAPGTLLEWTGKELKWRGK